MVQIQYFSCNFVCSNGSKGAISTDSLQQQNINANSLDKFTSFPCLWKFNTSRAGDNLNFYTVDLLFERSADAESYFQSFGTRFSKEDFLQSASLYIAAGYIEQVSFKFFTKDLPLKFLLKVLVDLYTSEEEATAVKLVIPTADGTIARSNYFETRLEGCEFAEYTKSFWEPLHKTKNRTFPDDLPADSPVILGSFHLAWAFCGIKTKASACRSSQESLDLLEDELYNRTSSQWIIPSKIERKVVAFLEGPPKQETSKTLLDTARNLGIDLVIIDYPGHWMERPENSHLCKAFLPINMTADPKLGERAAEALINSGLAHEISAIVSCRDGRLVHAANAMNIIGLSTEHAPPEAFQIATDKYLTRTFDLDNINVPVCFKFCGIDDLESKLKDYGPDPDIFPLVVKPCHGGGSEGVSKVYNLSELFECVQLWIDMENASYRHGKQMCAETYIEGPEVDANFILLDGEIVFFELVDDFPCPADAPDAPASATFVEGGMFYPSGLPASEYNHIKSSIHSSLLKMGFRSGVFHCEARIRNSAFTHSKRADGIMDVLPASPPPTGPLSVFLLEVNARPCGLQGVLPCRHTYGIDYYDALLLCAIGDRERTIALTRPFRTAPVGWSELVYITSPVGGVFNTPSPPCEEMMERIPILKQHLSVWWNLRKKGDVVPHPSTKRDVLQPWIASMVVTSKNSREEALQMAALVRKEFRYEVV